MGTKKQSSNQTSTAPSTVIATRVELPRVTPAELAAFAAAVGGLVATLNGVSAQVPGAVEISTSAMPSILKTRKGFEPIVASLVTVMGVYPTLIPAHYDAATLGNTLSFVSNLTVLQGAVSALAKAVDDTLLAQRGNAWGMSLAVYTILQRQAPGNPQLEAALAPMAAFLAHTKPAEPKDPSSDTGGAEGAAGTAATGPASASSAGTSSSTSPAGSSAGPVPSGTTSTGVPIYTPTK